MTSAEPTVGEILQQVQFELYRDNVEGALDILDRAKVRSDHPDLERERVERDPEFKCLEKEIDRTDARRILDAGCGEGRVALTIAALHPHFESDGHVGHVRVFTEAGLRERFGTSPDFALGKIPGDLPERFPAALAPIEFGSFFVALSKPR